MVDYNEIPDDEIDIESPATEYVKRRLRDNPLSMASGDAGFVYDRNSFAGFAAGEVPLVTPTDFAGALETTPTKIFSFACSVNGTIRVKFWLNSIISGNVFAQIYINGSPAGTIREAQITPIEFIEDIILTTAPITKVELYFWLGTAPSGIASAFGLYASSSWQFTNEVIDA